MEEENKNNEYVFRNWLSLNLSKNCVVCKKNKRSGFWILCTHCKYVAMINEYSKKEGAS